MKNFINIHLVFVIILCCTLLSNSKSVNKHTRHNDEPAGENDLKTIIDSMAQLSSEDGYVWEDMSLVQNDGPQDKYLRTPHSYGYGHIQRQLPAATERQEHKRKMGNAPPDLIYTKEIVTKQGRLKGFVRIMHPQTGLRNVDQYLGIPYAAAPIGNGRFMPPGAPPPWHGLKKAIELSPVCPQNLPSLNNSQHHLTNGRYDQLKRLLHYLQSENEDCLFLNLYVPKWSEIGPPPIYPVIVFIHGESYEWNSGNAYDGSILSSYGQVIVVTLNYRLGVLGFLKPGTTDHTVSNFGLLDQIAALQWVKDNIKVFGGEMSSVTLMGHSTGAACVNFLMLSPVARGLFHRAILMSGSAMSDWAIAQHPLQATMQVLHNLNCPLRDDNEEMLTCLRKKRYQDILKSHASAPEFTTRFGPVVDHLVIPNEPQKLMSHHNGVFSRYEMLFGLTEIESYHNLNAVGITHGLLENERDGYLRFYMENRFEFRPDVALKLTLQEYNDIYNDPAHPTAEEHRDVVLEILSDAQNAAPIVQTGIYQSKVNPRSYMYLFTHISKAGGYTNLPQSIIGEDLAYVFGAPLASARPFPSSYSPDERLLSEAIMIYWTNFAKTGDPKAPWRDQFLNLDLSNWERNWNDWPEFNSANLRYLNIGVPPVVHQNYRQGYMTFWNEYLPQELNRTLYSKVNAPFAGVYPTSTPKPPFYNAGPATSSIPHVNYYLDKSTENPIRQLQYLLHHSSPNRTDMYQTQSSAGMSTIPESASATPENTFVLGDNKIVVKADSTLHVLIAMVIIFLLINVIIIFVYMLRRNYYSKNLKRKLDVLSLDGTTDDELKRSNKFNDGDESFILDIVRRKNEYVPVKRYHSPINGFLLSRHYSTSTVDTHTKVSDWISQEVNRQNPKLRAKSPSFSMGDEKNFFAKKGDKISVAIDATPNARSESILRQQPIELMKSKSFDARDTIVCQEVNVRSDLLDSVDLRSSKRDDSITSLKNFTGNPSDFIVHIDHRHSRSDPVSMQYRKPIISQNEEITSFIEDVDVNVTSRDECDGAISHFTLSPEETLQIIQMRNYPKVLPKYPENTSEYVSTSSFKRRSMPSYQHLLNQYARMPPVPPPRTTSTLGRKSSMKRSNSNNSEPLPVTASMAQRAIEPPSPPIDEEPEITYNALHVGPLFPGSKENLYSTISRRTPTIEKKFTITDEQANLVSSNQEEITDDVAVSDCNKSMNIKSKDNRSIPVAQPKSIMKPTVSRANSQETKHSDTSQSQVLTSTTSKIPVLRLSNSNGINSNNKNSTDIGNSADTNTEHTDNASHPPKDSNNEHDRSPSLSSADTSSSDADTIKQIF